MLNIIHTLSLNAAITADFSLLRSSSQLKPSVTNDLKKAQVSELSTLTALHARNSIPMSRAYAFFVDIGSFILGRNLAAHLALHNANLEKLLKSIEKVNVAPILREEYRRLEAINHIFATKASKPYQTKLPLSEDEQVQRINSFKNGLEVVDQNFNPISTQVFNLGINNSQTFSKVRQDFIFGVGTVVLGIATVTILTHKHFNR